MVSTMLSDHYESLRDDVVSGTTIGSRRWGWNLLLTRGLAAWMSAWSVKLAGGTSSPAPSLAMASALSSSTLDITGIRLPGSLQQQMTSMLVEMILQRSSIPA